MSKSNLWVTGHKGFVGSNLIPFLKDHNITTFSRAECDLTNIVSVQKACAQFILNSDNKRNKCVIHLSGKVGGIIDNTAHPADFLFQNTTQALNVINSSVGKVDSFIQIGSPCTYAAELGTPFKEEDILLGVPEITNYYYAIAKRVALEALKAYKEQFGLSYNYLVAGNLYGPKDNLNPNQSHVIPAIILKFLEAEKKGDKEITIFGTGKATRDFLYIKDLCSIIEQFIPLKTNEVINIASGIEVSILDVVYLVRDILKMQYISIKTDTSRTDGQKRRVLDLTKIKNMHNINLYLTPLEKGLEQTIIDIKERTNFGS